jgi:hypothetical protein
LDFLLIPVSGNGTNLASVRHPEYMSDFKIGFILNHNMLLGRHLGNQQAIGKLEVHEWQSA